MWETHIQYKLKKKFIITTGSTVLISVDFLAKYTVSAILLSVLYFYIHTCVVSLSLIHSKFYQLLIPAFPKKFIHYSYLLFPYQLYSFALIFQVHIQLLTSRETRTLYALGLLQVYCASFSDASKMVNESHPQLFLNSLISHVTVCH